MKRNRFYFGILILILVMLIVWASYQLLYAGREQETHTISVIVNDSNHDRWMALHQGMDQAAGDNNINLNFVSTGTFTGVEEELALVERELENGAEGIIVQMVAGAQEFHECRQLFDGVPVMLLETDITPEGVFAITGPDNAAIGRALGYALKADLGENLSGKTIGILCGNEEKLSSQQRLAGVKEALTGASAEILWTLGEETELADDANALLQMPPVDIVLALENDETERMVDLLQSDKTRKKSLLYGVGCSEKAVYYLDKGVIRTLVVPNEFNMGYQSVESIAKQLHYRLAKAEDCQVDFLVVDRTNLYASDNQKILFPIVQ